MKEYQKILHHLFSAETIELCIKKGCLLWGTWGVIPKGLQVKILHLLHDNHPGITRTKALACSYIWWLGLDKDIECLGKSGESCQAIKSNPTEAPLYPWVWPDTPWTRIHVDYAGPFLGRMLFLVVDVHSERSEVFITKSTTSQSTIEDLQSFFWLLLATRVTGFRQRASVHFWWILALYAFEWN